MKPYIWSLAWSYNEAEFQQNLDRIFNYDSEVYDDVQKMKPRTWCRAFYKIGSCCEDVENNSTESFNSTITKAREKPFVPMLETVRRLAMARIAKRSDISRGHKGKIMFCFLFFMFSCSGFIFSCVSVFFFFPGICTPYVVDFLAAEHKDASKCIVTRSTNGMYEVKLGWCTYHVSLERRTCTCKKFEICGILCEHAYGVMLQKKLAPENFVCHWFRTDMWRRNYAEGLVPVRGAPFWPCTSAPDVHIPPDPKQPGKEKITKAEKKRKKGVNESPTKKQPKHKKRIMHCGICGMADHNSRFHTKNKVCYILLRLMCVSRIGFTYLSPFCVLSGCSRWFSSSSSSSFSYFFSSCFSNCLTNYFSRWMSCNSWI